MIQPVQLVRFVEILGEKFNPLFARTVSFVHLVALHSLLEVFVNSARTVGLARSIHHVNEFQVCSEVFVVHFVGRHFFHELLSHGVPKSQVVNKEGVPSFVSALVTKEILSFEDAILVINFNVKAVLLSRRETFASFSTGFVPLSNFFLGDFEESQDVVLAYLQLAKAKKSIRRTGSAG